MNIRGLIASLLAIGTLAPAPAPAPAAPGDPIVETCPSAADVGDNVACYPVTFTSKTEIHPDGIPIIGYLFVPKDRAPGEPLPAIVFAHGSGSMYSNGHHNAGLNSKHEQWVRQYTSELGFVTLHVDSFHSRYLLPDTPGDQRIMEIDVPPTGLVGGDDYRATSYEGSRDAAKRIDVAFDPDPVDDAVRWKDSNNGGAGVSEIMERAYDMDAAWDFLAGIRKGRYIENTVDDDEDMPTRGTPMSGIGYIGEIVSGGLVVDHERIFLYGTSHGGQTAMATAHAERALGDGNPMNTELAADLDRRRFAAFFDYYGGCGLHGAYGGTGNSTWRPYAPFLMLHGDHDDEAVFDEDEIPIDSIEKFRQTGCGKRIAAAKADPGFDQFLEAIVYKDTYHSFDGVERGDFNNGDDPDFGSWLAKTHANYRVTIPFMQIIGRIVSADRNDSEEIPSLSDFALTPENLQFTTIPFTPWIPPTFAAVGPDIEIPIEIPDLQDFDLDLSNLIVDPAKFHELTCEALDLPQNVGLNGCLLEFGTTGAGNGSGLIRVRVSSPLGFSIIEGNLNRTTSTVTFNAQERQQPPAGHPFKAPVAENSEFTFDVRSFFSTRDRYWKEFNYQGFMTWVISPTYPFDESWLVSGQPTQQSVTETLVAHMHTAGTFFEYTIEPSGTTSEVEIRCCTYVVFSSLQRTPLTLPTTDFISGFEPLEAVSEEAPQPPGGGDPDPGDDPGDDGPGGDDPGGDDPGGDDPGDDNSGDDDSGDDDSGDDDSGDDDSGDDDSGDNGSGDDNSGNNGPDNNTGNSSGGGALFWLLPFALLFRRR